MQAQCAVSIRWGMSWGEVLRDLCGCGHGSARQCVVYAMCTVGDADHCGEVSGLTDI